MKQPVAFQSVFKERWKQPGKQPATVTLLEDAQSPGRKTRRLRFGTRHYRALLQLNTDLHPTLNKRRE